MNNQTSTYIAVLAGGGLDSAVLIVELVQGGQRVQPIYIKAGLLWEPVELGHLERFLAAIAQPDLLPLVTLEVPVGDLYERHWSLTGDNVPDADTPDEAVDLPGRNLLLLSKALIWCHLNHVPKTALGTLAANPFADATASFFRRLEAVVNEALGGNVQIERPFASLTKAQVIQRGKGLPLRWTFSCLRPVHGRHCGGCNKCAERRTAFREAGVPDPTEYAR